MKFGGLITVEVFCEGFFEPNPLRYLGGRSIIVTDVDFASLDFDKCKKVLQNLVRESCRDMYYQVPKKSLDLGLRILASDEDYARFLDHAYSTGRINLYVDITHDNLTKYLGDDGLDVSEDEDSVFSDNISLDLEVEDEVASFNKTKGDPFLSKLCVDAEVQSEKVVFPDHDPTIPWHDMVPVKGMKFENPKQLKHLITNYAVANGYALWYEKNDSTRLLVRCGKGGCPFRLWATWMTQERTFQIKSLKDAHNCSRQFNLGSLVSYAWIAKHYAKEIIEKPNMSYREMQASIKEKFNLKVSVGQCRRAKKEALDEMEGTLQEHYAKIWSYAEEIRRSNPESTVSLDVIAMPDGKTYFSKFYVCFKGLKDGWVEGCRRVIGIDGCFLKGVCKGEVLSAIGRDANNHVFPIAWAVVGVENKETWKWFLELLVQDIGMNRGTGLTLLSDQHKGLIEAVKLVLPNAEHRQCARHVFANFKKRFNDKEFQGLFWGAAKATTVQLFERKMGEIKAIKAEAHTYLMQTNPKSWSRAFFEVDRCCDAFENGICESFNSTIVHARRKSIITMLEEIRLYAMDRMCLMKEEGQKWDIQFCPSINDRIDELKKLRRFWEIRSNGFHEFEARYKTHAYVVNIDSRTCTCRAWQLTGIPCVHGMGALGYINHDVNGYISPWFSTNMFLNAYRYGLKPMNGYLMWPATLYIPPLPPKNRRMPGRPKIKRKRHPTEVEDRPSIRRKGSLITCTICRARGHNKATCPKKEEGPSNAKPRKKMTPRKKRIVDERKNDKAQHYEDDAVDDEALYSDKEMDDEMIQEPLAEDNMDDEMMVQEPPIEDIMDDRVATDQILPTQLVENTREVKVQKLRKKSERILKKKLGKEIGGVGSSQEDPVTLG